MKQVMNKEIVKMGDEKLKFTLKDLELEFKAAYSMNYFLILS